MFSQEGPAPSQRGKVKGNVEYLSCALCDCSRNPIRLQQSLAWTMNPISLTVQDGEYLGEKDCFKRNIESGRESVEIRPHEREQTEEWLVTL